MTPLASHQVCKARSSRIRDENHHRRPRSRCQKLKFKAESNLEQTRAPGGSSPRLVGLLPRAASSAPSDCATLRPTRRLPLGALMRLPLSHRPRSRPSGNGACPAIETSTSTSATRRIGVRRSGRQRFARDKSNSRLTAGAGPFGAETRATRYEQGPVDGHARTYPAVFVPPTATQRPQSTTPR